MNDIYEIESTIFGHAGYWQPIPAIRRDTVRIKFAPSGPCSRSVEIKKDIEP